MISFIKKSLEELEHVVWPTTAESKKYLFYTVGTIIIMATLLAIVGQILSGGLKGLRAQFPHTITETTETVSGEGLMTREELLELEKAVEERRKVLSGAKIEVNGGSGVIVKTGSGK